MICSPDHNRQFPWLLSSPHSWSSWRMNTWRLQLPRPSTRWHNSTTRRGGGGGAIRAAIWPCASAFQWEYRRDLGTHWEPENLWRPSAKWLTRCKRGESITQWWIDYSHASFWEPIFLCELNLKLNLVTVRSVLLWQTDDFNLLTAGIWG